MIRALAISVTAILTGILGGCASTRQAAPTAPFNPAEAEYSRTPGRTIVRGQMFLRRNDGVVVYGAGSEARLIPKTNHSEQVIVAAFPGGSKIKMHLIFGINTGADIAFDPTFTSYIRSTKADGNGNFQFQQIPPGTYYVVGNVTWCVTQRYGTCDRQGGDLYETISIKPGEGEVQAILSGS